jgi:hypothetical protein
MLFYRRTIAGLKESRVLANAHFREYLKRELSTGLLYDREHILEAVERFRASRRWKGRPRSPTAPLP